MEAIVLAGGFGTRLRSVVKDLPKPMAPVNGRPFLAYVLDHLQRHGVSRFILSVGYKHEAIQDYFGDAYRSTPIVYAVEKTPLGTGGGIRQSLGMAQGSPVLVLNGDTFFDVDLDTLLTAHSRSHADVTIAAKYMDDPGRYGSVTFDETGRLVAFREKAGKKGGHINGGIYVMGRGLFDGSSQTAPFSFETDFLQTHHETINIHVVACTGYFIDIGLPGDYEKAGKDLAGRDE